MDMTRDDSRHARRRQEEALEIHPELDLLLQFPQSDPMGDKPKYFYFQSGVIPYRWDEGKLQILLISSRARSKWVVPKGIIEPGMDPEESAAKEAFEEAGIGGTVHSIPVGNYSFNKWGGTCQVQVFPMEVQTVLDDWPERNFRRREWMSIEEAVECVQEPGLRDLIIKFNEHAPS